MRLRKGDGFVPHFTMPTLPTEEGSGGPRQSWGDWFRESGRSALALAVVLPYGAWLFFVLAPVGAVAYGLASVAGTVWANVRTGWNDHK